MKTSQVTRFARTSLDAIGTATEGEARDELAAAILEWLTAEGRYTEEHAARVEAARAAGGGTLARRWLATVKVEGERSREAKSAAARESMRLAVGALEASGHLAAPDRLVLAPDALAALPRGERIAPPWDGWDTRDGWDTSKVVAAAREVLRRERRDRAAGASVHDRAPWAYLEGRELRLGCGTLRYVLRPQWEWDALERAWTVSPARKVLQGPHISA